MGLHTGLRPSPTRDTSARDVHRELASPRLRTAIRSSSRRRRRRSSTRSRSATSAPTGSRTSTGRFASTSSATVSSPPLRTPGRSSCPTSATPFLGREQELFDAVSLVYERDPRVLDGPRPGRNRQDALLDRARPPARRRRRRRNRLRSTRAAPRSGARRAGGGRPARRLAIARGHRCPGRRTPHARRVRQHRASPA